MAVKPAVDVFKDMNNLVWREIAVPCVALSFGFSQGTQEQKYIFRDEALIESLGRSNRTFRYTIPFRQNAAIKYTNLYTEVFPQFLEACLDRTADILIDPIHGEVRAKVVSLSYELQAGEGRDGIDIQAEFVSAPLEGTDEAPKLITVEGAKGDAGAFDRQCASVQWEQELFPEPTVDIFNVVSGLSDQVTANINKYAAALDRVAFQVDKTVESLERLGDVKNWSVIQSAKRLKRSCSDSKKLLGAKGKIVRQYIVPQDMPLGSLCAKLKSSRQDLLNLNPRLARSPSVRANTVVLYLAGNDDGGFIKVT